MTRGLSRTDNTVSAQVRECFGGPSPDRWFGWRWLTNTVAGFAVPVMSYLFWTRRGVAVWGTLATRLCPTPLGRSTNSRGLMAQVISGMPVEMA